MFYSVTRYKLTGTENEILLDVNSDLYPLTDGARYRLSIYEYKSDDSYEKDEGFFTEQNAEYVMAGMVFRFELDEKVEGYEKRDVKVYASFGGLIMQLNAQVDQITKFGMDQKVYLMMRKVETH